MRDAKPNESEWNSSDYKTAIKTVKTGEDGKMPTFKNDLREMWKNLKHREVGMFVDFDESTSAGAGAEPIVGANNVNEN